MSKIHILIGLPRAGKSTRAEELKRKHGAVIVRADDIRLELTGQRFQALAEDYVHATKMLMIRTLYRTGHIIIADGTHTRPEHIAELAKIDPVFTYDIIDTDKEECIRRAILTQQDDLIPVIERMAIQLEQLKKDLPLREKWN